MPWAMQLTSAAISSGVFIRAALSSVLRSAILAAGAIGITYIALRVPSKERVLAERAT